MWVALEGVFKDSPASGASCSSFDRGTASPTRAPPDYQDFFNKRKGPCRICLLLHLLGSSMSGFHLRNKNHT